MSTVPLINTQFSTRSFTDLRVHKVVNHVIIVFGTKVVFVFQSSSNQRVGRAIYLHAFWLKKYFLFRLAEHEIIITNSALRTSIIYLCSAHRRRTIVTSSAKFDAVIRYQNFCTNLRVFALVIIISNSSCGFK